MIVAILGPDGSGKTTLAKSLARSLDGFEYYYLGYNENQRKYPFFESFIHNPLAYKFPIKIIRRLLIILNDLYFYNFSFNKKLVSDRYIYDKFVGLRLKKKPMRLIYGILIRLVPVPKHLIFLYGNEEIISARKNEISAEYISHFFSEYSELLRKMGIDYVSINCTENNIEQVKEEALSHLKGKNLN